jgi:uncharacterized protein YdaU (DUF1376 family)
LNYYKFNIGDYAAATRHLTMLEHGAYRLLMDVYYTTEQPLPSDAKATARKTGARTKDEIAAVETVLNDFFVLTENGWIQNRCDSEIEVFRSKAETNKVIGKMGGRPKKKTQTVISENPEITQTVSEINPHETLTTNHKPRTINQEPNSVTDVTAIADGKTPDELTKAELWAAGKSILSEQGMPKAQCGSFVGKLVKDYGDGIVIDAVRAAVVQRPADAAQYLVATCQTAIGQRKPANKQEALEARNRAVADAWANEQEAEIESV